MVIGDAGQWDGLFPYHLLHRIFDLVVETWEAFDKPAQDDWEVPITRRFRRALKHSKDLNDLPFRVKREDPEDDFETGEEIGRKDITFEPMVPREEVYFVFECKRLNALVGGELETLAPKYVTEGITRFVSGQYAYFMNQGGMIAYILDGRCEHAMGLVERNIKTRHVELKMEPPGAFLASGVKPGHPLIRETKHKLPRLFLIHHIFLGCPVPEVAAS
jgi:hypothetical protein